jgi:hypothetical protein
METEVYYKKVFIKTEADLPDNAGMYFVGGKDNLDPEDVYEWFNEKNPIRANNQNEYWIGTFDWYLLPIPSPSLVIEKQVEIISTIQGIVENTEELNMVNYSHEQVGRLNEAMVEIYTVVHQSELQTLLERKFGS